MEGKEMFKSFKRLAAGLLIAIFIVGSLTVTSAEAALKKPGNARFVQWNNTAFSSCRIRWNAVSGAEGYQIRCTWTDGSHAMVQRFGSNVGGVDLSGLDYRHVYQFQVRAFTSYSYGPWSNIVFITPWPKNVSCNLVSSRSTNMKVSWNIIYGCNGYNIFMTTNPSGTWYWNLSTSTKATATSATVKKYRGSSLKTYTNYYVRVITRRKRNGVFCTVPEPYPTYYQRGFRLTRTYY
jgi:hypothetical protein